VTASPRALELVNVAAAAADSKQAEDLVALDVSGPLPLTDVFLVATGRNERNVVAIAGEIEDKMLEAGAKMLRREGRAEGRWILLDFGDVIVHVFHEEDRMYYSLERLWKDCPSVPLDVNGGVIDSTEADAESADDDADAETDAAAEPVAERTE
jgi:ribosome-associated protein